MAGELADHNQPALPAGRAELTCLEGNRRGARRLALPVRGREGGGRVLSGEPELELVQERPRDGTPQPVVPDLVEALGPHVRQKTADTLLGWEGHGVPTRGLRVRVAAADLLVVDREPPAIGQRHPVDVPTQGRQDWRRALHGGVAGDHPPVGPDRLGDGQVRAFLPEQLEKQPAKALREGMDGPQGRRAGRHSVRSAETPPAGTRQWTWGW
jgi:hypothetical protein